MDIIDRLKSPAVANQIGRYYSQEGDTLRDSTRVEGYTESQSMTHLATTQVTQSMMALQSLDYAFGNFWKLDSLMAKPSVP